jgi:antitoxin ParD1/3/4
MSITMNISLSPQLKSFVDERVKERGYSSHSEYVRDLVRHDEREAAKDRLRALIGEGLAAPQGRTWDTLKSEMMSQTAQLPSS